MNETDRMVHGLVQLSVRVQIPVRRPAVTVDRSAGFDPVTNNSHQGVGSSVRKEKGRRSEWHSSKPPLVCGNDSSDTFGPH